MQMKHPNNYPLRHPNNYCVDLDINKPLDADRFEKSLRDYYSSEVAAAQHGQEGSLNYSCKNGNFRYESETLLPNDNVEDKGKKKVLLVFGNPAVHSVANGMFFFSKTNSHRHQLWGKLAKAGLIKRYDSKEKEHYLKRVDEATYHRNAILNGSCSKDYLLGLTTFFSLPTWSNDGVQMVGKLFKGALDQLAEIETQRILAYPFSEGATLIFTEQFSYDCFTSISDQYAIYWPMRNKSGENLKELLTR